MGILHWLMLKTGVTQEAQRARTSSFETLEPRVLLSADLAGVQPFLASEAVPADQAIYVDLKDQSPEGQQGSSPVLTCEALPDDETSQSQTEPETLFAPELEQAKPEAVELFSLSPALFVENQGQWSDPSVRYVHDGDSIDVAMTDTGVVFRAVDTELQLLQFSASFVGANVVRPVGLQQSASLFNYYPGDQTNWRQNVPSYEVVAYEGLYEGVDLRVRGLRSHVKYEFHVAPGADYRRMAVHYEGIEGLSIGEDGSLQVNLGAGRGVIRDNAPYIYQEIDGQKVEVAGRFVLLDSQTYSFEITGVIDPDHALVIDPDLVWSTYLGGTDRDEGAGIAVDADGYVYVTGQTESDAWTSGGFDTIHANAFDAFVVKLSPDGQHVWSTYLGGDVNDEGSGIAVDSSGDVYVTGTSKATGGTDSPNWTSGGFDTTFGGNWDAFVVKLSSEGAHLWSTFLGGSGYDWGYGIAVDSSGNAYVTGYTDSSGWASGGYDTRVDGTDAFVAKISSDGTELLWSTYIGGNDLLGEGGNGIAVDSSGNVYVTGFTESSGWTSGGFNPVYNGGAKDAFVVKLSSSGAHVWSTYLGGGSSDVGYGIAVSSSGNVYVTGNTNSAGWTSGGFDTTYNGGYGSGDAFVVKLSSGGAHLWSTYLGGVNDESGYGIAVDVAGNAWVTGSTYSPDWTSGGFDTTYNEGSSDAFAARLRSGGALLWSTYVGGSDSDSGDGIAVDATGHAYATGTTASSGWTSGGFDTTFNGGASDGFVVRIDDPDTTPPTIDGFSVSPTSVELGGTFTISYTVSDSGGLGLNRVELWRTDNLGSWPAQAAATNSVTGAEDGPVSGDFLDAPPADGDWWYGLHVYDTAGNLTTETSPIYVVVEPATPPSPNPSTWATPPHPAPYPDGTTSIQMVATPATDPSGVEYYFREISDNPGATDSGWQDSNEYVDTGLVPDTTYTYQVMTRDRSINHNETQPSDPASATTDADTTLPTIIGFTVSPAEVTLGGSFLVTYTVSDSGGAGLSSVQLWRIDSLGASELVAENSAAGNGPVTGYLSDYPASAGTWTYGLNVSDAAGNWTASDQSPPVVVNPPDTTPPSPNPSTWATAPHGTGPHSISMAATPATDPSSVEYYFHEMSGNPGATDSDWQDSNVYEDTGLSPGMLYKYEVRTRDKSTNQNETAYSASASAATASPVYRFWKQSDNTHFYTIKESERLKLIKNYSDVYTYEGVAFYAYVKDLPPAGTLPVYRFWKASDNTHFYTIKESERQKLIKDYSSIYTFEGVAYYAFMPGQQPADTLPVYRFWKASGNTHFYTITQGEKDMLIYQYSSVFTYETIVWYAYLA